LTAALGGEQPPLHPEAFTALKSFPVALRLWLKVGGKSYV